MQSREFARIRVLSPLFQQSQNMIETNPIRARIADLTARVASLRGYL